MRLKIPKLAASPICPLHSKMRPPRNFLLKDSNNWIQDINYLRDNYNDIILIWEELKEPEVDNLLHQRTEPKLRELVMSLMDVVVKVPWASNVKRLLMNARHDFEISAMYARAGDFGSSTLYQSYSLVKIHDVLESLTRAANTPPRQRFSSASRKTAYGYDISGEVFEGSGELANRENEKNINDTAEPQDHHETPPNPANQLHDVDADKEFKGLREFKEKRVIWPPRTR